MDNWQPAELAWSFARKTHFDSCPRHYFYHRFWGQDPKLRWKLFEMRNITTLMMLRGSVVHIVIAEALNALRLGYKMDLQSAKSRVTTLLREKYMESQKKLWHIDRRPQGRKTSDITNILEHYYDFPQTHERAREAQLDTWKSIENLWESELWRKIMSSSPSNWMVIEESDYPSFDLDGIKVYATIDFAYNSENPTIIDWKTGSPSESDQSQITLYSLYAKNKWDWDLSKIKLKLVYLQPELHIDEFTPSEEDLNSIKMFVKSHFEKLMEYEPAFGNADPENFPMTDDLSNCKWCRFQGLCPGGRRLI